MSILIKAILGIAGYVLLAGFILCLFVNSASLRHLDRD